ncbi:MbtH protein [Micromonospora nigra]|uniref:MbtH protein n=1 Tax=Micromonospora nigra TaxID=145857 RepID=A0A1C6RC42_9ACTN|nr:MbtH family protein [Micromonospora nigra]SCL14552.1 MbtH protein [Micromonospora nigra]
MEESEDSRRYQVVVNDEEQYSIWPDGSEVPAGWRSTGFSGGRADCLAHIDEIWTDLRPRSLREWLATQG